MRQHEQIVKERAEIRKAEAGATRTHNTTNVEVINKGNNKKLKVWRTLFSYWLFFTADFSAYSSVRDINLVSVVLIYSSLGIFGCSIFLFLG